MPLRILINKKRQHVLSMLRRRLSIPRKMFRRTLPERRAAAKRRLLYPDARNSDFGFYAPYT